ncbi:MAG TPA: twin-arginine translocation signal domain-containing protein, partial [Bacteroidetes bacterium]|nr:twin-arginine translocation signal domain-containing protein [Bacteroidota bacterium]
MNNLNRRDFIKMSSAATAGVALTWSGTGFVKGLFEDEKTPLSEALATKVPTVCEVCFWNCAGWAYLDREGGIQKIKGNDEDPHCNGRLCPRGTGGVGMYSDNDRLKKPMIRVGEAGNQKFKEVSWEEAIDYIVKKMKEIEAKHGK